MSYNPQNPNGQATSANSSPVVVASDQSALPITDNSGSLTVDQATGTNLHTVVDSGTLTTLTTLTGTTTLTPGTGASNLGKAEDAAHTTGDVGVFSLGVGNEAQSTLAADGDYVGLAVDTKGNTLVAGNVAHDGVDAGNPIKVGGIAKTALPTAAAADDRVNAMYDKFGRQVTLNNAMRDLLGSQTTTISNTTETTIITAAASIFNDLVTLFISNTSATAARVDIRDTTGGSVIFQLYLPAGDMRGLSLTTPWPQTSVNTNWTAQASASVTDLRISAMFVKNK